MQILAEMSADALEETLAGFYFSGKQLPNVNHTSSLAMAGRRLVHMRATICINYCDWFASDDRVA